MAHVLVVDDDPQLCQLLTQMLAARGHRVTATHNGDEALAAWHRQRADLVITDILMPQKDGIELISVLKVEAPELKILAVSGGSRHYARHFILGSAEVIGADAVLAKPFTRGELLAALDHLL